MPPDTRPQSSPNTQETLVVTLSLNALVEGLKTDPERLGRRLANCGATIKVRTPDNQGEKMFCRLRRREGGALPERKRPKD